MEGSEGCRQEKRVIRGFQRISRGTAPGATSGTEKRKPAHRSGAIICSRRKRQMNILGTAAAVRMAGIRHASDIVY